MYLKKRGRRKKLFQSLKKYEKDIDIFGPRDLFSRHHWSMNWFLTIFLLHRSRLDDPGGGEERNYFSHLKNTTKDIDVFGPRDLFFRHHWSKN